MSSAEQMDAEKQGSIPCVVVTGALGSGKTTLIRDLLQRKGMEGTALIINEFGEVGLDHLLVSSAVETTLLMENGCLCCSLRGDLVDTVLALIGSAQRGEVPRFDRIVIETTGLADPLPIVRDLSTAPVLKGVVHLAGVTTCIDGLLGLATDPVAIAQVTQADLCLLTKSDMADPLALDQLREKVQQINPLATIMGLRQGRLPDPDILFKAAGRIGGRAKHEDKDHSQTHSRYLDGKAHAHHGEHAHNSHSGVESWSILLDHPLPWARFRDWFDLVYSLNAGRMLRMKGLLWVTERQCPVLVQAVGPVAVPMVLQDSWPGLGPQTRLVLIARDLEAAKLDRSFREHALHDVVGSL